MSVVNFETIITAVKNGNLEQVKAYIENHPQNLEQKDQHGQTLLLWAASTNQKEILSYLISMNADVNVATTANYSDHNGKTALYWALEKNHFDTVTTLLNAGAIATTKTNPVVLQPIHLAVRKGRLDLVQAFIEKYPELLDHADQFGRTSLFWAVEENQEGILAYLISKNAKLDVAINCPPPKINVSDIDMLLAHVFPSNELKNSPYEHHQKTSLYRACELGHTQLVIKLLKAGADATITVGKMNSFPIHIAVRKGGYNIVKALIESRADLIDAKDVLGQTPLIWAASLNQLDVLEYLIDKNANLDATTNCPDHEGHGNTALDWAIKNKSVQAIAIIVNAHIQRVQNKFDPASTMYASLDNFRNAAQNLPPKLALALNGKVKILADALLGDKTAEEKAKIIESFQSESIELIQGAHYGFKNIICALAISAAVVVVASLIGFGIGMALGAWSGPGAFLTGLMAGSTCAIALTAATSSLGLGSFVYSSNRFFAKEPIGATMDDIANTARKMPAA